MIITLTAGQASVTIGDTSPNLLITTMNSNLTNTLELTATDGTNTYTTTLTGDATNSSTVTVTSTDLGAGDTFPDGVYNFTLTDTVTTVNAYILIDESLDCDVYNIALTCPDQAPLIMMIHQAITQIGECDDCTGANAQAMYPILIEKITDVTNTVADGCNC